MTIKKSSAISRCLGKDVAMFLSYDELKRKADAYVRLLDAEWSKPEPDYGRTQQLNATLAAVFECQRECRMYEGAKLAAQREDRIASKEEAKAEAAAARLAKKRKA